MSLSGIEGFAPPPEGPPGLQHWFAQLRAAMESQVSDLSAYYTSAEVDAFFPVSLANGGTGRSLTAPTGLDKILFWDDSAGQVDWLQMGKGLRISGTSMQVDWGSSYITEEMTAAAAQEDLLAISDAGVNMERIRVDRLFGYLESVQNLGLSFYTPANDTILFIDADGAGNNKIRRTPISELATYIGGATNLNALSDVIITSGDAGDFLRHNGSEWVDATIQVGDLPSHTHAASQVTAGTFPDNVNFAGWVQFQGRLDQSRTYSGTGYPGGLYTWMEVDNALGPGHGPIGVAAYAATSGAGGPAEAYGLDSGFYHAGSGTVAWATDINTWVYLANGSGNITEFASIYIAGPEFGTPTPGSIGTLVGLDIVSLTAGTTANYAIRTGLGRVQLGGDLFLTNLTAYSGTGQGGVLLLSGSNEVQWVALPAADGTRRFLKYESDSGGFGWTQIAYSELTGTPSVPSSLNDWYTPTATGIMRVDSESTTWEQYTGGTVNQFLRLKDTGGTDPEWVGHTLVAGDIPAHDIVSTHSASGLTVGHVMQATGTTDFGFAALAIAASQVTSGTFHPARVALTTAGDLLYAIDSSTLQRLAIGTSGYVLKSNGAAPVWQAEASAPSVLNDLTNVNAVPAGQNLLYWNGTNNWIATSYAYDAVILTTNLETSIEGLTGPIALTGRLGIPDGTVSAPSFYLTTDGNTGFYRYGTDDMGFAANGVRTLNFTQNGLELYQSEIYQNGLYANTQESSLTVDWTNGNSQKNTATTTSALTVDVDTGVFKGTSYTLVLFNNSAGTKALTITGVSKWATGSAPTSPMSTSSMTVLQFFTAENISGTTYVIGSVLVDNETVT